MDSYAYICRSFRSAQLIHSKDFHHFRHMYSKFYLALIGAYMSLRALSWYLGAFPNEFLLARKYHLGLSGPVSWKFYLYVIALVILTASSSALQYWLFTKKSELTNQSKDIDE